MNEIDEIVDQRKGSLRKAALSCINLNLIEAYDHMMNLNIGRLDRLIRVLTGALLIGAGIYDQTWWGAVGVIPLATGIAGICPIYYLLGINTKSKRKTPSI